MTIATEKMLFKNRRGLELAGRLERPAGEPIAWAIFAHCFTCSKDVHAATRVSRALAGRGFAVLRFDFTGLGNSGGDFANTSFTSNVEDLVDAAAHLREVHTAPALLIGHSLGGAAVLAAAGELPEVRAVATIGAPSDVGHVAHLFTHAADEIEERGSARVGLGGREFEISRSFVHDLGNHRLEERLRDLQRAVLIFHSPMDDVVGIDHARRIYEGVRGPKSFVTLDGADHLLTRPADSEYVASVLAAWAARYVGGGRESERPDGGDAEAVGVAGTPGTVLVEELAGGLAQRVVAGRHELFADEPASLGGTDRGPGPSDYLLAGLGACTSMTLRMYAKHKGWPLERVAVSLRHDRIHAADCEICVEEPADPAARIDRIERELTVEGDLDEDQRARLLEIADRCPVHKTLLGTKDIVTRYV
jgi:putative redox protein